MPNWLKQLYKDYVLQHTWVTAIIVIAIIATIGSHSADFRMDASADSLILENDRSLEFYRKVKKKYGTDDYLFITFQPKAPLFSDQSIKQLKSLKDQIAALPDVETVISLVDAPIFNPDKVSLANIENDLYFIEDEGIDLAQAKQDILSIPLYRNLLVSTDGETTAIQANLKGNPKYFKLNDELRKLQWKRVNKQPLSAYEAQAEANLRQELRLLADEIALRDERVITQIRNLKTGYQDVGTIYLGGIPMIAYDMIDYVKSDLVIFGLGVFVLLVAIQAFIFRRARWIIITLGCCTITAVTSIGILGVLDWPVTVISSNFVALLLIITMSLVIHLIVRFRQVERDFREMSYNDKILETISSMFTPCAYTSLTTIVAFGSLMVSDIRPVIDFGKMMIMGVSLAFVIAFLMFPLLMKLRKKSGLDKRKESGFFTFTNQLAKITDKWRWQVASVAVLMSVASAWGISYLSVDNRFIDYFKSNTEIHQGMKVIDTELGGTTPLEIIIERSAIEEDFAFIEEESEEDEWEDEFEAGESESDVADAAKEDETPRLWMTSHGIDKLHRIQNFLESISVTGKTLSLAAGLQIVEQINGNERLSDFELALLQKKIPEDLREQVLSPFYDRENDEVRFLIRVKESDPELDRNQLLADISDFFVNEMKFSKQDFHFTGMLILYNNMLESLFKSQILTLGVVFGIILLMFIILFRSITLALLGMFPNLVGACFVLGLMGWSGIPLDMMTITIAAISIGIAVDNTIHYIHRFKMEYARLGDYTKAMYACHDTIARAMYFTSITIIAGFSVLVLSNFMPSIYFGVFTSLAMFIALLANLTLLPVLLLLFKPLQKNIESIESVETETAA
ncbi:efflux RND transporter permease subunit [Aliikangiella coralliicola]|uniref:MMPL family transporter n=1 Tax=Aliikangiella coralliicola TaxID=2592383 RepID=A0A545UDF3_9GAMM|nr:MMPL family transporter [Aliikangiella coralliicola]TQV87502.1 MMPL family transporter [Aliikangiella coralliicola]